MQGGNPPSHVGGKTYELTSNVLFWFNISNQMSYNVLKDVKVSLKFDWHLEFSNLLDIFALSMRHRHTSSQ